MVRTASSIEQCCVVEKRSETGLADDMLRRDGEMPRRAGDMASGKFFSYALCPTAISGGIILKQLTTIFSK